jgi:drug/metabolite transporter (DMT)-like permease
MKAHNFAEVSVSAVASQTKTIYSLLLGVALLGEGIGLSKLLGVLLVFAGVTLSTVRGKLRLNKGVIFVLIAAVVGSVEVVFDKYALRFFPVAVFVFVISIVPVLLLLPFTEKSKERALRFLEGKNRNVFLTGFLAAVSYYTGMWAISLGEISKIIPVLQSFTAITVLGGIFLLREKGALWKKLLGAVLAITGVVLVKLS